MEGASSLLMLALGGGSPVLAGGDVNQPIDNTHNVVGAPSPVTASVPDPCGTNNSCSLTVIDSLTSSATVTLPPAKY